MARIACSSVVVFVGTFVTWVSSWLADGECDDADCPRSATAIALLLLGMLGTVVPLLALLRHRRW